MSKQEVTNRTEKDAEAAAVKVAEGIIVPVDSVKAWATGKKLELPAWAKVVDSAMVKAGAASIAIQGDTDGYVQEWLKLLGNPKPDQFVLEVCYQCAKMDVQQALVGTPYDPRVAGKPAEILFTREPKWALKNFPTGLGAAAASRGRAAREVYKRVRGAVALT